jgi:DnaK suppressor protein
MAKTTTKTKTKKTGNKKTDKRLEDLKVKLFEEREQILVEMKSNHNVDEIVSHGDLVDQSNNYSERENLLGLAEHDRNRLLAIDEALAMIEKGTYGQCAMCGEEIPEPRLIAMPTAKYCVKCQSEAEIYG